MRSPPPSGAPSRSYRRVRWPRWRSSKISAPMAAASLTRMGRLVFSQQTGDCFLIRTVWQAKADRPKHWIVFARSKRGKSERVNRGTLGCFLHGQVRKAELQRYSPAALRPRAEEIRAHDISKRGLAHRHG